VRAVVLTGAGKNFCFGGDLRAAMSKGTGADAYLRELTAYLHSAISQFVRMDAPVIAAVNGTAAGAGLGLMLVSDLAVCGTGSKFTSAYTGVGLTPDAGTSFMLPRVVGAKRAMELMLLNRVLTAKEALEWGLVNEVVSDAEVVSRALEIGERLASGGMRAFGRTKRLVAESLGPLERQMVLEAETIVAQSGSPEGPQAEVRMNWVMLLFIVAGAVVVARIFFKLRDLRNQKPDDWDARAVDRLRKQGSDPFKAHEVDFFFALPDENACRAVNVQLEREGYAVDIKAAPETPDLAFSLHARKEMRLSVPDMQALSRRFKELATTHGGRYDGWAANVVKSQPDGQ
jgi:2-(1,2-epoxy-1,2-dihydrophenyl)acetyl-CoA isomerase